MSKKKYKKNKKIIEKIENNKKNKKYQYNQTPPQKPKRKVSKATEKPKKTSPVKAVIIASICILPFLIFGAALVKMGIEEITHQIACSAEVKGEIVTDVSVQIVRRRTSKWHHYPSKGYRYKRNEYSASYTFKYNGETFTDIIKTSHKNKKGDEIKVRCDPDNPEDHYVKDLGDSIMYVFLIIFGIIWDAIWVLLILMIWRLYQKPKQEDKKQEVKKDEATL